MEAEHYTAKVNGTGSYITHYWSLNNAEAGASGYEYMEVMPNEGTSALGSPDAPVLEYDMNISTAGTYYVWIRRITITAANDSCCTAHLQKAELCKVHYPSRF